MSLPGLCKTKEFISLLSVSVGVTMFLFTFLIWPAIIDVQAQAHENTKLIASNNVPGLRVTIDKIATDVGDIKTDMALLKCEILQKCG